MGKYLNFAVLLSLCFLWKFRRVLSLRRSNWRRPHSLERQVRLLRVWFLHACSSDTCDTERPQPGSLPHPLPVPHPFHHPFPTLQLRAARNRPGPDINTARLFHLWGYFLLSDGRNKKVHIKWEPPPSLGRDTGQSACWHSAPTLDTNRDV